MRVEITLTIVLLLATAGSCAARRCHAQESGRHARLAADIASPGAVPARYAAGAAPHAVQDVLVRAALAEARWSARDHGAIWHVLQRWARRMGWSIELAVELRVNRFSRRPPRWITRVTRDCVEPWGWPRWLSWGSHKDLCHAAYARADAFLAGHLDDPCGGRARDWRAPGPAFEAALALGRRRVWCGRVANVFVR